MRRSPSFSISRASILGVLISLGMLASCTGGGGHGGHGGGGQNNVININGDIYLQGTSSGPNITFTDGTNPSLVVALDNIGNLPSDQLITVTVGLPNGVTYVSFTSTTPGWTCNASGQTVTCTSSAPIAGLTGTSTFLINVSVASSASGNTSLSISISTPDGNPATHSGNKGANFVSQAPSITSVTPSSGPVGTSVTIAGSNFGSSQGSSTVTFNGTSAGTAPSWSATSITVNVPTGATTGNVVVTVGGVASSGVAFTVTTSAGPNISTLDPTAGAVGTAVIISGSGFGSSQGTSTVTFNGTSAGTATNWSSTSISVKVPTGATTGPVVVTVGGVGSNGAPFTVTGACGTGDESLLSGHYAMVLYGFDNGQPAAIGAVFDANGRGGVATGGTGIEDINSAGNLSRELDLTIDSTKSSYSVGADWRGCLRLVTVTGSGNPVTTAPITFQFRFAVGSVSSGAAGEGHIIEFDSTGSTGVNTAGVLERQDTTAFANSAIAGTYAFGASARELGLGKFAIAGVFTADGSGNIPGGAADYNSDNGGILDGVSGATDFPASPLAFAGSGNGYTVGSAGRGDWTFALSDGTSVNAAIYVVNAQSLLTIRKDPQSTTSPLFAGTIFRQSKSSFGPSDLNATSVGYTSGVGAAETRTQLFIVTPNGSGSFNIALSENDGGVPTGGNASGSYTVASNGRVVISGVGKHNSILYLVAPNEAFSLGGGGSCFSGFFAPQSATTIGSATPAAFGVIDPEDSHVDLNVGVAVLNNGTITGTLDDNSTGNGGTLSIGQSINFTYSIDSTGTGLVPANCNFAAGTCSQVFLVISPTEVVLMDAAPTSSSSAGPYPALRTGHQ
jgi:hypothetical protein